ncbi:MAG TPA: hypothetical protein DCE56_43480 [Cyanobacteria bacterium UBA8553]|nr:hypothetical protein [Cyanobacteria bacterium UBA8553]HAJ59475.1 hypothetical protein [Cyanobacteria bacterium UBA8543]
MNSFNLDVETGKIVMAMMSRNSQIGAALIAHLRTQLTLECVAGVLLVSIQRTLWFDPESVAWSVENLIPADIMREIQNITSFTLYKHLIGKGFVPGQDLSVDANGSLLVKEKAQAII